jgi:hypothetical protein
VELQKAVITWGLSLTGEVDVDVQCGSPGVTILTWAGLHAHSPQTGLIGRLAMRKKISTFQIQTIGLYCLLLAGPTVSSADVAPAPANAETSIPNMTCKPAPPNQAEHRRQASPLGRRARVTGSGRPRAAAAAHAHAPLRASGLSLRERVSGATG